MTTNPTTPEKHAGLSTRKLRLHDINVPIPVGLHGGLAPLVVDHCIGLALSHGFQIPFAIEAENPGGSARYIGVRLER